MRFYALACDYDGTLATDGHASAETLGSLQRLRESGRKLILVTGRVLSDVSALLEPLDLFDRIVAENGAVYRPASREERALAEPPPAACVSTLARRGVEPLQLGRVVIATMRPHETTVLAAIRDLGLELQVIFNRDAVMVLPSGVNKGTGLRAGLEETWGCLFTTWSAATRRTTTDFWTCASAPSRWRMRSPPSGSAPRS